jgi:large subunit ribosomal protein L28
MLTGKKANNGWSVSFSHIRNKKLQGVNLQYKRIFWAEQQRYIRLRISTKALKTIQKKGLEARSAPPLNSSHLTLNSEPLNAERIKLLTLKIPNRKPQNPTP